MEEQRIDKAKLASTFGLIIGSLVGLFEFLRVELGIYFFGTLSTLILIFGLIFSMIKYRETLGGYINYGQVVKFGIMVTAFTYLLFGILMYFYATFINTGYISDQFNISREAMQQLGLSDLIKEDDFNNALQFANNPLMVVLSFTIAGALQGGILSLIFGIFIKRAPQN